MEAQLKEQSLVHYSTPTIYVQPKTKKRYKGKYINSDKSKLLLITKPTLRHLWKNIKLHTSQYIIEQSIRIKVLGIYITSGFSNIATINNIISKVNYCLNILKEIFKYSSVRTKKILTNSIIVSVIRYAAPILINSNNTLISKLQVVLIKCSRPILGFKSYKYSTQHIIKELNWLNAYQIITKETIIFIHKII